MNEQRAPRGHAGGGVGKLRWINWTCLSCDHAFRRRTRRGLTLTCPHCGAVQRGPEGVRELERDWIRLKTRHRGARPATDGERRTVRI